MRKKSVGKIQRVIVAALLASFMAASATADVILSEIDVQGNNVELVNTGTNSVNISAWQWCNRLNGSPFYAQVSTSSTIDTNLSTATSFNIGAGEILVLGITAGLLPNASGELGLYTSASFGSASAMEDYVGWGANGVRDSVAAAKGIWGSGTFIDVSSLGSGESMQLGLGNPGDSVGEYFVGTSSLGVAQSIPEPSTLVFMGVAGVGGFMFRRRLRR